MWFAEWIMKSYFVYIVSFLLFCGFIGFVIVYRWEIGQKDMKILSMILMIISALGAMFSFPASRIPIVAGPF